MRVMERRLITWVYILDWMQEITIGSFRVEKGLTVRHWATTKGNPFLTGLGYTRAPSARRGVFEEVEYVFKTMMRDCAASEED